jgi:hypothetical protein
MSVKSGVASAVPATAGEIEQDRQATPALASGRDTEPVINCEKSG